MPDPELIVKRYKVGEDFTKEEINSWLKTLSWWISESQPRETNPKAKAKKVLLAALNGTKLDGSNWPSMSVDFFKRVKQLCSFDLKLGVGTKPLTRSPITGRSTEEELPPVDLSQVLADAELYKESLLQKYPHLENEVYAPKVDELAETVMRSRMLSRDFYQAKGKTLETLNKIRESLHKQQKELMEFLEISPRFLMSKKQQSDNADVGSLVAKLESYGRTWEEFERLDALRELIQKYKQLNTSRPNGTPQLDAWELWHMTRCKPVDFTCRCGETYTLLDGFTPEEIEQALLQAYDKYGFGLTAIGEQKEIGENTFDIEENEATS